MRVAGRRAAIVALTAGIVLFGGGAAHASGFRTEFGCTGGGVLEFFDAAPCPEATTTGADPTPPPTDTPSEPVVTDAPTDPVVTDAPTAPAPATDAPVPDAPADPAGMAFTANPATLTASTLSIEGLRSVEIVMVDLADGTTMRALKITADRVVVDGFGLDVPAGDGGLDTTATTLVVDGNVRIWTPSITAILEDGVEHVIDTLTQPDPASLAQLVQLRLPLLGMMADSVAYTGTDQSVYTG